MWANQIWLPFIASATLARIKLFIVSSDMAGRPKGTTNHHNRAIKELIIAALDRAGGEEYFVKQSQENPVAFMTLVGKVIPSEVHNKISGSLNFFDDRAKSGE